MQVGGLEFSTKYLSLYFRFVENEEDSYIPVWYINF